MEIIIKKEQITDSDLLKDKTLWIPDEVGEYRVANNNVPLSGGLVEVIPQSEVNLFNELNKNNPDYCIEHNIVIVKVIKDDLYYSMIRKAYRDYTGEGNFVKHIDTHILEEKAKKSGLVDSSGNPLTIN